MIIDSLYNSSRIEPLHPLINKAFEFVKKVDFTKLKDGTVETDDPRVYLTITSLRGKDPQDATIETHHRHIDILIPLSGVESIGWKAGDDLVLISEPYNREDDITRYYDFPTSYTKIYPGQFALCFPEDGHATGIGQGNIRKVTAKISLE